MKYLNALFGLSLAATMVTGACVTQETASDDDDGGNGGGAPTSNILTDSPRLAQADIERRTYYLASPELEGREPATAGGLAARQYIIDEMNACGLLPLDPAGFEQPIATLPGAANVLAVIPGTDDTLKDRYVMVAAHYDHLGVRNGLTYAGADDNAIAVSTMISVGCALMDNPQPRSVVLAAFDAEEPPNFLTEAMGSVYYANNPVVPNEQVDVMIALELIGSDLWPGYQNHMVLGTELSPQVNTAFTETTVPEGLMVYPLGLHLVEESRVDTGGARQPWSDYDAFRNIQVPVLLMVNAYNDRYHTPQDTPDTLNYPKAALQAKYILQLLSRLANAAETPVWSGGADYARDAAMLSTMLEHAVAQGGIVESLGLTPTSRSKIESDLAEISTINAKMNGGEAITDDEVLRMRYSVQRIMCLTSGQFPESVCSDVIQ